MVTILAVTVFVGSVIATASAEVRYRKTVKRRDAKISEWQQASKELNQAKAQLARTRAECQKVKRNISLD